MSRKSVLTKDKLLAKDYLETMTTKRLLSCLHRLQTCHDTINWNCFWEDLQHGEVTKDSEIWGEKVKEIKDILAKREHLKKDKL